MKNIDYYECPSCGNQVDADEVGFDAHMIPGEFVVCNCCEAGAVMKPKFYDNDFIKAVE